MNTNHLKYIIEVEKIGSISRASENLNMNQPQLSKAIRDLENHIGGPIFKRTSKGIITTAKGEEFLMHARHILSSTEALENLYKTTDSDELRFNFMVPRASYIADAFYNFLQSVSHKTKINGAYNETSNMNTLSNIAMGECNIGIIRYNVRYEQYFLQYAQEKDMRVEPLYKFNCNVLVSKDSALAKEDLITKDMLLDGHSKVLYGDLEVPFLPLSKSAELIAKRSEKKHLSVFDRQSQYETLLKFPKSYSYTSPVSPDVLKRFGLVEKKTNKQGLDCKDVLVYKNDYVFTEVDNAFIEFVKAEIDRIQNNK